MKRSFRYEMDARELQALVSLSNQEWRQLSVQGGRLERRCASLAGYSISSLLITAQDRLLVVSDSMDMDGLELFRISVIPEQSEIDSYLSHLKPTSLPVVHTPADLPLQDFLKTCNRCYLVRTRQELRKAPANLAQEIVVDSGLLFQNSGRRMLVLLDHDIPLNLCVTTDPAAVSASLRSAFEIRPI